LKRLQLSSVHPQFDRERYLAALQNPDVQILGHPRGRIYNYRLGLTADWARVLDLAAKLDKAVEIDAYPDRQDLSLDLVKIAKKSGCRISLGTDSNDQELGFDCARTRGIPQMRRRDYLAINQITQMVRSVDARTAAETIRIAFLDS
jgi:hypothetical protein